MRKKTLPTFDSISELARFWERHDLTDYEDELEEIIERVFERPKKKSLTISLGPQDWEALRSLSRKKRRPSQQLVNRWVLDKLHEEKRSAKS